MSIQYDEILSHLGATSWDKDNVSIVCTERVDLSVATRHYCAHSFKLSMILCDLMGTTNLSDVITSLQSTINISNGLLLLYSLCEHLLLLSTMRLLDAFTILSACIHTNGGTVDGYGSCLEIIFNQIDKLGYKTTNDLKLAFHQSGMLQGVYSQYKPLFWKKKISYR